MTKNAWVTVVFGGDAYVPGALVLAQSLCETNTRNDTVCLVTPDVSAAARKDLAAIFTSVKVVPYITCANLPPFQTLKQRRMYASWIQHSFTRFNAFSPAVMAGYDKVVLLDCDLVFICNCDHLFDIGAPAMTFSSPWARPYCRNGGIRNAYINDRGEELQHGDLVPTDAIRSGRENGIVGRCSMVSMHPSAAIFDELVHRATRSGPRVTRCSSGFDEQLLVDVLLDRNVSIYNIHQRYNWVVGKETWLIPPNEQQKSIVPVQQVEPSVYQWYGIKKPWDMVESQWPDLVVWYNLARNVVHFYPETARHFKNLVEK